MFDSVIAEHERAAEVSLPVLEDGAEVAKHDVVSANHPIRRVPPVGLQRVRSRAHDPLVPIAVHAEHLRCQIADRVARLRLAHPGSNDSALRHCREQLNRLGLRVEQPGGPGILVVNQHGHPGNATGRARSGG